MLDLITAQMSVSIRSLRRHRIKENARVDALPGGSPEGVLVVTDEVLNICADTFGLNAIDSLDSLRRMVRVSPQLSNESLSHSP